MSDQLRSILLGTADLSVATVVALLLTLTRGGVAASDSALRSAVRLASLTTLVQAGHFVEELTTGFHRRFPEFLGLSPWSLRFFVSFNLVWIAAWVLSLWGLGCAAVSRCSRFGFWELPASRTDSLIPRFLFEREATSRDSSPLQPLESWEFCCSGDWVGSPTMEEMGRS